MQSRNRCWKSFGIVHKEIEEETEKVFFFGDFKNLKKKKKSKKNSDYVISVSFDEIGLFFFPYRFHF